MEHKGGERFELLLQAQKSDVLPACRLRGLLKAALRTWGLRCLSVRDVTPTCAPGEATAAAAGQQPEGG